MYLIVTNPIIYVFDKVHNHKTISWYLSEYRTVNRRNKKTDWMCEKLPTIIEYINNCL